MSEATGGGRLHDSDVHLGGGPPQAPVVPMGGDRLHDSDIPLGGFLLLDKPVGVSSFQALHPVKKLWRGLKVGHAGTLDPAASGLLLVGLGNGTRLLEFLEGMDKAYTFLARFGLASDTYDMDGRVSGAPALALERARVEAALEAFRGPILQAPPAYSAIKVEGERAYDLARAGAAVELPKRPVTVHALELTDFADGVGTFRLACSKGTYVRSLVHDLGKALGCGAVADRIRRTGIGPYRVEDAVPYAALKETLAAVRAAAPGDARGAAHAEPGAALPALLPLETAVSALPAAVLAAHRLAALRDGRSTAPGGYALRAPDGRPLSPAQLAPEAREAVRVVDDAGRLLAIAALADDGELRPRKVLVRP